MHKHVILCIDDGAIALQARSLVLQHHGYEVLSASTAKQGLEIFREQHVDLVLLDHFLGDGLGTSLAADMKRLNPCVPIVILSGSTELPDDMNHADLFITKLEPTLVVLQKIAELLEKFSNPA